MRVFALATFKREAMREDMARAIVERPRHKPYNADKGRDVPVDMLPANEGMRRGHAWRGDRKQLNEPFALLRRYLEKQVGRPWDKVHAEIARHRTYAVAKRVLSRREQRQHNLHNPRETGRRKPDRSEARQNIGRGKIAAPEEPRRLHARSQRIGRAVAEFSFASG